MNLARQILLEARRDWRLTDVKLLLLALIVAVTAVTSVSFFTNRVDRAMRGEATALLGADILLQSSRPIPQDYIDLAGAAGLQTASVVEFPSVAVAAEQSTLTQVKAVSDAYPLRGDLMISERRGELATAAKHIPAIDEVWVEERVLLALDISPGETITLGNSQFRIGRLIVFEPDRGGSVFQLAPRVLMNQKALQTTGLLTPASRAQFRLLLAGEEDTIERFSSSIKTRLKPYEQLQSIDDGRSEISTALDRASRFMALAAMLTVILCGAAVALASNSFSQREINRVAIYRTLGAVQKILWHSYGLRLLLILCSAAVIGSLLGFLAQLVLGNLLQSWIHVELPAPNLSPLFTAFATAVLTLAGFALPPVIQLLQTPPMRILRNDVQAAPTNRWLSLLLMALSIMILLGWQAGDWKLATRVFGSIVVALVFILLAAAATLAALRKLPQPRGGSWRMGVTNLSRFNKRSALLIATFATGVLTITLLSGVRDDLMQAWENNVPADAPNHFLINIQPAELPALKQFFYDRQLTSAKLYPMVRGRLLQINEHPVSADDYESQRAQRLVNREFNLSAAHAIPNANTLLEGDWFRTEDEPGFSVEADIAGTLGFAMGDSLLFDIAGQEFRQTITSVRKVQWDTMQPNFFVMTSPALLSRLPSTYITSLYVPPQHQQFSTELVRQFPSITTLDVKAILEQVRKIIMQASRAVEYVFLFTLLAGLVVLIAAVQTQRAERRQEIALLKSYGAPRKRILHAVAAEFSLIGALAGFLGSALAILTGWVLATQVFELSYQIGWMQIVLATLFSAIATGLIGIIVIRRMLDSHPVSLFQKT